MDIRRIRDDLIDRLSFSHEPEALSCELLDANRIGLNTADLDPKVRIDPFQILDLLLQVAGMLDHAQVLPHTHFVEEERERQYNGKDSTDQKRGARGGLPDALQRLLASVSPGHIREDILIGARPRPDGPGRMS
jgi:hypothetical protein